MFLVAWSMFEFDVVVSQADFARLEADVVVGVADAIDLVADELAKLGHVLEQVEHRARRTLDDDLARTGARGHHPHLHALGERRNQPAPPPLDDEVLVVALHRREPRPSVKHSLHGCINPPRIQLKINRLPLHRLNR